MLDIGPAGIVASHPQRFELPLLVAPRPEEQPSTERNTIRAQLVTIGCMRLFKAGFAFDSSVVGPEAERSFTSFAIATRSLAQLRGTLDLRYRVSRRRVGRALDRTLFRH